MADNKKSSIGGKSTCHLLNVKQPDRVASRIKFSFKRTHATINILKTGRIMDASLGFIDISETGAGFFTEDLLLKGSTVEVCVMEPRILKLKALVAWSVPIKSGIKGGHYAFRSGLQFIFENEIQRSTLLEYIQKANSDPLEYAKGGVVAEPSPPVSNADPVAPAAPIDATSVAADGAPAVLPTFAESVATPTETAVVPSEAVLAPEAVTTAEPAAAEAAPAESAPVEATATDAAPAAEDSSEPKAA